MLFRSAPASDYRPGAVITIAGSNFDAITGVTIGGAAANWSRDSSLQITATIPDAATLGPGSVVVTGSYGSDDYSFTVKDPAPSASYSDHTGAASDTVSVTGSNFTDPVGRVLVTAVLWNGHSLVFDSVTASSIAVTLPSDATGSSSFAVVTSYGSATTSGAFSVAAPLAPAITEIGRAHV